MASRLLIGVLGNRKAGKSRTWNTLFGRRVRTGKYRRHLTLRPNECVEVFLISGSAEERGKYAGDILEDKKCRIVLCSLQYTENVYETFDYFTERGFQLYIHWLNPGYYDHGAQWDRLGIVNRIISTHSMLGIRSGQDHPATRVQEIRECIYGWAKYRGLIFKC